MNTVHAIQDDTFDSIAYRYYGKQSVVMLPALLEANSELQDVVLQEYQRVNLPELVHAQRTQTLKLWD
ncbi:tail protein X [Acinetobacter sp. WZC-1]|uniref:tail protein X n=1 Tax=Acinetobacter sp. WZC-1 TaxID=3459034 RepID=UPI00403D9893